MVFLKEEIEVVVGDPEVEGFRELKNERRESGFCWSQITIGPERVGNEDSEHDGLDKPIYEEFRLRQEVLGLKEAFRTKSEKNWDHPNSEPAETQDHQFFSDFVFELSAVSA